MNVDDDSVLVQDFKNGNEKAFELLFNKYHLSVYSVCYRFVRNESDARELTQDTFIKTYNNLVKFNEKSKFFTWLYRIAINTCISFVRTRKKRIYGYETSNSNLPMDRKVRMKVAIDNALMQLPERQRMCFILHHYEGHTFVEVGRIMGITSGAAKANHHHAIKKLRNLLEDWL